MSDSKIFIPELWEPKVEDKLDNYALKAELNHFILKNTDINMNDHIIENVKNSGSNDAVNMSYVDNAIASVTILINTVRSNIPYMRFIKESVTGSSRAALTINKSIEDPILNGLKLENILYFVRGEHTTTLEVALNFSATLISISNNTLNIRIRIRNEIKTPWESPAVVYVYILIVHQKHIVSDIQNDEPSDRSLNELPGEKLLPNVRSDDYSSSFF